MEALTETAALLRRQREELLEQLGEYLPTLPRQQGDDLSRLAGEMHLAEARIARVMRERESE